MISRMGSKIPLKQVLAAVALITAAAACRSVRADSGTWKDASPADLKQHLGNLETVVEACRKARNTTACDPSLAGPNDRLHWTAAGVSESREIRYDWLRDVLDLAGKKETTAPDSSSIMPHMDVIEKKPQTVDELLGAALSRLKDEEQQVDTLVAGSRTGSEFDAEHRKLAEILSRRAYKGVARTSPTNKFWEWLQNLLNKLMSKFASWGGRARWLPGLLLYLLIGGVLIGLGWSFVQIERRSRIRLIPETSGLGGAPSAREWQLWLKDAQDAAAGGLWRDAIHFLYWAAISRLESRRLWPADRARTPREYLILLPKTDSRRDNLTTLTRSFERTWYGGREAALTDYEAARAQAAALGVE
ncbi:MAG TPA: DUF4129 domain-containing protein [Terracidiphilus sp.]|nr:DUF4129 domain-containing protein [Terracidiphilus sp.]